MLGCLVAAAADSRWHNRPSSTSSNEPSQTPSCCCSSATARWGLCGAMGSGSGSGSSGARAFSGPGWGGGCMVRGGACLHTSLAQGLGSARVAAGAGRGAAATSHRCTAPQAWNFRSHPAPASCLAHPPSSHSWQRPPADIPSPAFPFLPPSVSSASSSRVSAPMSLFSWPTHTSRVGRGLSSTSRGYSSGVEATCDGHTAGGLVCITNAPPSTP